MPEYRCTTMCFHTVDTGRGLKHRLFKIGDVLTVPEGVGVPDHFVRADTYKEPAGPRQGDETSERYSKRQFPPLVAPIDKAKVAREAKTAKKEKVTSGGKNQSGGLDRY